MARSITNLVKAGAVSALCQYFHEIGGKPHQWKDVREYAYREWRDVPTQTLDDLVSYCRKAVDAARAYSDTPAGLKRCEKLIPTLPKGKK